METFCRLPFLCTKISFKICKLFATNMQLVGMIGGGNQRRANWVSKRTLSCQKVTLLCKRNVRETRDNITKVSRILEIQEIQIMQTQQIQRPIQTKTRRDTAQTRETSDVKGTTRRDLHLTEQEFCEWQDWQFLQCFVFRRKLVSRLEGFEVCKDLSEFSAIVFSKL